MWQEFLLQKSSLHNQVLLNFSDLTLQRTDTCSTVRHERHAGHIFYVAGTYVQRKHKMLELVIRIFEQLRILLRFKHVIVKVRM